MQISALFIGFLLVVASVVYVSLPLRQKQLKDRNILTGESQKKRQREAVLTALRDLDFDFKTGKISDEDYQPLRAQLVAEAAQYIEAEEKEAEQLEALIQARRAGRRQNGTCQHCGAAMQADQRFCAKCGSAAKNESCPSCGKEIHTGDLFCTSCGTKVEVQLETVVQS